MSNKSVFAFTDSDLTARVAIAKGTKETQFLMSDLAARYPTEKPSEAWLTICKEEKQWPVVKGKFAGLNKALELTRDEYTIYLLALEAHRRGELEEPPAKMAVHVWFENAATLNRIRVQQTTDKKLQDQLLAALQKEDEKEQEEKSEDITPETAEPVEVQEQYLTVLQEIEAILTAVKGAKKSDLEEAIAASLELIANA